ncbi:MFS transporter [Actinomadura sp. SCN-SB]|uniref:MFS transporter n=1 Tax=Actinomadura sp. SCN-SB TaxID=3373092 RepID=UPI00375022AB
MVTQTVDAPRRARVAVTVAFLIHGLVTAAWVARIPQIKQELGLSEGALGLALLGAPVGVVLAVRSAGWAVARFGSRAVTLAMGAAAALSLVALGASWNLGVLTGSLFLMGATLGLMDVGMNAQGVIVERRYARPLMSGLHASYSIGTLGAALAGSAAAQLEVPVEVHLSVWAALLLVLLFAGCRGLLGPSADAPPESPRAKADIPRNGADPGGERPEAASRARAGRWALALLGVIGLCSFVGEGAMADWSAVYLRETLRADPGVAGLAFAGFSVAMAVGRLAGDRLVARFGPVAVLRIGALTAVLGLGTGLAAGNPAMAVLGCTLFGLGVAPVAPITFSAAGNLPGVPAATGLSRVVGVGYTGLLAGPPIIGFIAGAVGLTWALVVPVGLAGLIALLAAATATAGR